VRDFGNLAAYAQKNAELALKPPAPHRVVFYGDSITEYWDKDQKTEFADPSHINRGISGQTTSQMLLRFRQDVIALKPEVVVILAGTNDIAGNTGAISPTAIADNIASMAELARVHHIRVILCSVLPAAGYYWIPEIKPVPLIAELNGRLKAYAKAQHFEYLDYFPAMDDGNGGLRPELSGDGVHPNAAGYAIMNRLVEAALARPAKTR
jgi:lysophospholipase L1-like esterase